MIYARTDLIFLGRMNIRYHENRELHYERFINWTAFASVLLSSAAFVAVGNILPESFHAYKDQLLIGITLLVTALNGAVLAFGMFNKFTVHADLKKQWIGFLARVDRADDTQMGEVEQAFHEMNTREPVADPKLLQAIQKQTQDALGWS